MPQLKQAPPEPIAQAAGRILIAWKSGHSALLVHELEHARRLTSESTSFNTFDLERLEALDGAVESLRIEYGAPKTAGGAVRVLEHLAQRVSAGI